MNRCATVLLVEDTADLAAEIADVLEMESYVVHIAGNGCEALQLLFNRDVDIIITDLVMPEMDGLELKRNLQKHDKLKSIPVVLLTAKGYEEIESEVAQLRFAALLKKPCRAEVLIDTVRSLSTLTGLAE